MALELKTQIEINASSKKVWEVLTDFNAFDEWNPFIKEIKGEVKKGNKISVKIDGMKFKPLILAFDENKELRWIGRLFFKGLFDGEHRFKITENGDGKVIFEQSEKFTGILVPFLKKKLFTEVKDNFNSMNLELKKKAE